MVDTLPTVAIAYRGTGAEPDAILAYSEMLSDALSDSGRMSGRLVSGRPGGGWNVSGRGTASSLPSAVKGFDGVVLQYNPFSYGWWGVAPWLVNDLVRLRRAGTPLAVMVHEAFLQPLNVRQTPIRTWQKAQLRAILGQVDIAFATTEAICVALGRMRPQLSVAHIPVGSNLPDRRDARRMSRERLGLSDEDLALVAFGTGHPSQLGDWIGRAVRAAASIHPHPIVLNLGAGAHPVEGVPPETHVLTPGRLSADELAEWLAAGDLFLSPFSDGVSTRRTTVMAALQHELPVVTTQAPSTDRLLLPTGSSPMRLVGSDSPEDFEAAVLELVADADKRRSLGAAGRRFFEENFSWTIIAGRFLDEFDRAWSASPTVLSVSD
jgi:glycosyltransferase involved in cell wall biosynthesis